MKYNKLTHLWYKVFLTVLILLTMCCRQEAIVAAISEKDAHIALLEMTPNSNQYNIEAVEKLTQEKIQLQKQLSEVVRDRVSGIPCPSSICHWLPHHLVHSTSSPVHLYHHLCPAFVFLTSLLLIFYICA